MNLKAIAVIVIFVLPGLWALPASATWSQDPAVNNPVCTEIDDQWFHRAVSDGAGGVIFCWMDERIGESGGHIYAQRMSADGTAQWGNDGVTVNISTTVYYNIDMISDDAGGVIIVWSDDRGTTSVDVYAQRVSAEGLPLWTADGAEICMEPGSQSKPNLVNDGTGGAIVAWADSRSGSIATRDIYAQRVNSDGAIQWAAQCIPVCTAAEAQNTPRLVSDGAGGALIGWRDTRWLNQDIYAQRLNANGIPQWPANGVAICTAEADAAFFKMVSDGAGGAVIGWVDHRTPDVEHIYTQKVSVAGTVQWAVDGVPVSLDNDDTPNFEIVPDDTGGAIFSWLDHHAGPETLYTQRINTNGAQRWPGGVEICGEEGGVSMMHLVRDGYGGAVISWSDGRVSPDDYNIYAQRVSSVGAVQWALDGIEVCTVAENQLGPTLVSDGAGGALVGWVDERSGVDRDIYAQQVDGNGYLGGPPETINAAIGCLPCSGTVPFSTRFRVTMYNLLADQYRRVAGRLNILLANGSRVNNWRAGSTTLSPGETYNASWYSTIPAISSMIGPNQFMLELEDVTQAPYNQPPYLPSGDTDSTTVTVTGIAP